MSIDKQIYIRPKEICELTGIALSTFWRWTHRKDFPKKIRIGKRCSLWKKEEIIKYLENMKEL